MNASPHSHQVRIENYGSFSDVVYGDQTVTIHRPTRYVWDSDARYARKVVRQAQRAIAKAIRQHDRISRMAGMAILELPTFAPDEWASERLS